MKKIALPNKLHIEISLAEEGNDVSAFNTLQHIREAVSRNDTPDPKALRFLVSRLLPNKKAVWDIAKTLTKKHGGHNKKTHEDEIKEIKIGADYEQRRLEIRKLPKKEREKMRLQCITPSDRAKDDLSNKYSMSKSEIERCHKIYKEFSSIGAVDTNGDFVLIKYNQLFNK